MKKYRVILSSDANRDYDKYMDYIIFDCSSPLTAFKHRNIFYNTLKFLEKNAEIFSIKSGSHSLMQYGSFVRTITFKKMTIIYTVHDDVVYIHRIVASSLLTDL
jgi:hypothetical protein